MQSQAHSSRRRVVAFRRRCEPARNQEPEPKLSNLHKEKAGCNGQFGVVSLSISRLRPALTVFGQGLPCQIESRKALHILAKVGGFDFLSSAFSSAMRTSQMRNYLN